MNSKYCSNCGAQMREGARFCPRCGMQTPAAVAPQSRFCANCGAAMAPDARFCLSCGTAASSASAMPLAGPAVAQRPPTTAAPRRRGGVSLWGLLLLAGFVGLIVFIALNLHIVDDTPAKQLGVAFNTPSGLVRGNDG